MSTAAVLDLRHAGRWPGVPALRALPVRARMLVGAAVAFLLGGTTSFAQTVLPAWIGSFANSSSGWTLLVVLIVAVLRAGPVASAVLGPICFTGLTLGYQVVSTARGYPTSEEFFLIAGVIVGPFTGLATAWLRVGGARAALGSGLLAGIAVGEGTYGLTRLLGTTSPVYWTLITLAGVALLAVVCLRSLRSPGHRVLAAATTATTAAAFLVAYSALG